MIRSGQACRAGGTGFSREHFLPTPAGDVALRWRGKPGYPLLLMPLPEARSAVGSHEQPGGEVVNERVAKRVAGFGISVFTEMSSLAIRQSGGWRHSW